MRHVGLILAVAAALSGAAAYALQNEQAPAREPPSPAPTTDSEPAEPRASASRRAPAAPPPATRAATPMPQRIATLGLLNKRNGIARDLKLRPGQSVRIGEVVVRLRACERTAPWEDQQLTGAFVQVDVAGADGRWRRPFSGWLFAESPSLNVVEHPIYDVWPKSCEMRHPEIGPNTVSSAVTPGGAKSRSTAKKSPSAGDASAPRPKPAPAPIAPSSNDT